MGCGKRYWGNWDCEGSREKWMWTVFPHSPHVFLYLLVVVKLSVTLATYVYINILFYLLIYKKSIIYHTKL